LPDGNQKELNEDLQEILASRGSLPTFQLKGELVPLHRQKAGKIL
jgi:hypothetical protein